MRALWVTCLLVSSTACGGEGDLSGSLSDIDRLDHDEVRARLYTSELSIEYAKDDGSVPVRVTLRLDEVDLSADSSYDLIVHGAITGQLRDGTQIPPMVDGTLEIVDFSPNDGSDISGSFDARFDGVRDVLSLSGDFDTKLSVINWPLRAEDFEQEQEDPQQ